MNLIAKLVTNISADSTLECKISHASAMSDKD
jgi:hypothetical protein